MLLAQTSLDILGLSETWLTSDILDSEILIQGYSILRKDRNSGKQGGGIVVFVRDNLHISLRSDLSIDGIEAVWIELKRPKWKPMVIGSIYRPPDEDADQSITAMDSMLHVIDMSKTELVILGDFNIDLSPRRDKRLQNFCEHFLLLMI